MRSTNNSWAGDIDWDGIPKRRPTTRALRIAPDSPTRLLRADQRRRCTDCGNFIDWYYRANGRPVSLHPAELDATTVPELHRWHVHSGIAHPHHDGTPWCRVPHLALCPARSHDNASSLLNGLRQQLATNTRRLIDNGRFTARPAPVPADTASRNQTKRAVVQLLYIRYLAPGSLDAIRCVAQTRTRRRCTLTLTHNQAGPGEWRLVPVHPTGHGQLPLLADTLMAVYHLEHLPYAEQLRWRAQRCTDHATLSSAADVTLAEWEVFDADRHHQHICSRLPEPPHRGRQPW